MSLEKDSVQLSGSFGERDHLWAGGSPQVDGKNGGDGAKANDDTPHVVQEVNVCADTTA